MISLESPCKAPFAWSLPPHLFADAFPFHFVCDRDLTILQTGQVLQRMSQTQLVGSSLGEHFRISRPKVQLTFEAIKKQSRALFLLESLHSDTQIRGQMMYVEEQDTLFFLGSPWITDTKQLAPLGLKLKDFAIYDPIVDFLFLVQAQNTAIDEARKLTQDPSSDRRRSSTTPSKDSTRITAYAISTDSN
jgi:two-component system, NtrC family, sensor kinase